MSWQPRWKRPDLREKGAALGKLAAMLRVQLGCISQYRLRSQGGGVFKPILSAFENRAIRRSAIGVASGLLLVSSLFLLGPDPAPGSARGLLSDAGHEWPAASGAERVDTAESGGPLPASASDRGTPLPTAIPERESPPPTAIPTIKLDPLPEWVQSAREARLWSEADQAATELLSVPADSRLRVLGEADRERLPVYHGIGLPSGATVKGWIDLNDVRPLNDPTRVTASARGGSRTNPDISTQEQFIAVIGEAAQESQVVSRVPASVTVAQAILESDWGRSQLAKRANNLFGIKALSGPGPAGVINMNTWEVISGRNVTVNAAFRAYNNVYESVADHDRFLTDNKRYAPAFKHTDNADQFTREIHKAGYATDPAYTTKLVNLMKKYNLYRFDLKL